MSEEKKESILYEVKRKVAIITIDRPPVHALDIVAFRGIVDGLQKADENSKVTCVLIRSTGTRIFSAGIDTKKLTTMNPEEAKEFRSIVGKSKIPLKMLLMKKPVIVQVQGSAIGFGMILVMAADLRVFADRPKSEMFLKMPELELSMDTGAGSSFLPVLSFGLDYGKSIMLTADRLGLKDLPPRYATRTFPLESLETEAENFAKQISNNKSNLMYLLKSKQSIFNQIRNYQQCFGIEQEVAPYNSKAMSTEKWDEYLGDLFKKYL